MDATNPVVIWAAVAALASGVLGFVGGKEYASAVAPSVAPLAQPVVTTRAAATNASVRDSSMTATEPSCPATTVARSPDAEAIDRVLRVGSEEERFDALVKARNDGSASDDLVRTVAETDQSPRMRLLAFEFQLQRYEGDPAALRAALEAAQRKSDWVLSQDAGKRLRELPPVPPAGWSDVQQQLAVTH